MIKKTIPAVSALSVEKTDTIEKGLPPIQKDLELWDTYSKPTIKLVGEEFNFTHNMVNDKLYADCIAVTPLSVGATGIRKCWASQGKSDSGEFYLCKCGNEDHPQVYIDNSEYTNAGRCPNCDIIIDLTEIESGKRLLCGPDDKALINRIGNKYKHGSTLEHLVFSFDLRHFSRALLQELSRHRMASPSVKSTRYTLKELIKEDIFDDYKDYNFYKYVNVFKADNIEGEDKRAYLKNPIMRNASRYLVFTGDLNTDVASLMALENLQYVLKNNVKSKETTIDYIKYCLPESYRTEEFLTINARSLQNLFSLRSSGSALWEIRELTYVMYAAMPEEYRYLFEDYIHYPHKEVAEDLKTTDKVLNRLAKGMSKEEFVELVSGLYPDEQAEEAEQANEANEAEQAIKNIDRGISQEDYLQQIKDINSSSVKTTSETKEK